MRKCLAIATLALLPAWPFAQAGQVEVRFVRPDTYADANLGVEAERTRQELADHLAQLGRTLLPPQRVVVLDILDIDLAGEVRYTSRAYPPPRVLLGRADWPAITLRYTVSEDGRTVRQGEERVTDMNYMSREVLPAGKHVEPLAYEKRMLGDWFRERLAH